MDTLFRLLIVEDNPGDVRLIREMLAGERSLRYDVQSAGSLRDGVRRLEEENFDAVLLDLGLPDSQGVETLARLRRQVPDTPIVVLTGTDDVGLAVRAVRQGAQDYLVKGQVTPGALARSTRYAIERRRAEDALRRSEQRYRFLFTNMLEAYAHCRMIYENGEAVDFVYVDVNEAFEHLTSMTGVVGKKVSEVMPTLRDSNPEVFEILGRVATTGVPDRFEAYIEPLKTWVSCKAYSPAREHFVAVFDSITERKKAEEVLKRYAVLSENARDIIMIVAADGRILDVNRAASERYGYTREELLATSVFDLRAGDSRSVVESQLAEALERGVLFETNHRRKDGAVFPVEVSARGVLFGGQRVSLAIVRDITERKRSEERLRQSEQRYRFLFTNMLEGFAHCQMLYEDGAPVDFVYLDVNEAFKRLTGLKNAVGKRVTDLIPDLRDSNPELFEIYSRVALTGQPERFESYIKPLEIWVSVAVYTPAREHFVAIFNDITERKRVEEAARKHMVALTALHKAASHLAGTLDPTRLAEDVTRSCVEVLGAGLAWVGLARPEGTVRPLAQFPAAPAARIPDLVRWDNPPTEDHPSSRAIRTGAPVVVGDIAGETVDGEWRGWALGQGFRCAASFPLVSRRTPFGSLTVYSRELEYASPDRVEVFQTFAHQVAAAMSNARLFQETERRLRHVEALRRIDRAITASLDKQVTFHILLGEVTTELRVDAADVLMVNRHALRLSAAAAVGFETTEINATSLRLGEDDAGVAALEHRTIVGHVPGQGAHPRWASLAAAEGFVWRAVAPLVTKGEAKGVLEVYRKTPFDPDDDWLAALDTFAGQACLAIDSALLFEDLQRSNVELKLAYDATIEGWSRALDLRDKETEGHTQRVTALTVRLARAMGMKEEELVEVRRGALLHDIGKVGVPDAILHKPGPLTDEEWQVMCKHPTHAFELLQPIRHLRSALDIPFAHHERWDGSGYPRGRKAEQIPLAARIFAVVDVWDALRSDRPYRAAWPAEKVRAYLREHAGTMFDPQVVERFLALDLESVADV